MGNYAAIFIAPGKYVQGRGAILEIGEHISLLGDRVLVVGGESGLAATREGRKKSFSQKGIYQIEETFAGEASDSEINRLTEIAKGHRCNVIVASGGGKAIDAAKATAANVGTPIVVVPTTASTDAPCSALSVIYNEDGTFNRW